MPDTVLGHPVGSSEAQGSDNKPAMQNYSNILSAQALPVVTYCASTQKTLETYPKRFRGQGGDTSECNRPNVRKVRQPHGPLFFPFDNKA